MNYHLKYFVSFVISTVTNFLNLQFFVYVYVLMYVCLYLGMCALEVNLKWYPPPLFLKVLHFPGSQQLG